MGRIVRVGERVGERTADPRNGFELNIKVSEFRKFVLQMQGDESDVVIPSKQPVTDLTQNYSTPSKKGYLRSSRQIYIRNSIAIDCHCK